MPAHGTFVWNELRTPDLEKAKAFYAETLGWEFEKFPILEGEYWVARAGGEFAGGLMDVAAAPGSEPGWFGFIEVDDVDARVAKAKAGGAQVMMEPVDVPNVGRVAVLRDPTGVEIGWMTSPKQG